MPDTPPWATWSPGTRVVVRRRLADSEVPDTGETLTDVIGEVVRTGPDQVVLRRADGSTVTVPTAQVVTGKAVPPRPQRRTRNP